MSFRVTRCFRPTDPISPKSSQAPSPGWSEFPEGIYWIGHEGSDFAYDNEKPRHRVFLEAFQLSDRVVTCGEYLEFINDNGYKRPEFWLSQGWGQVQEQGWQAPLYWHQKDGHWLEFTLAGLLPLDQQRPVCHVSYFEADAYARWAGARLPTEAQWEVASANIAVHGNWADTLFAVGLRDSSIRRASHENSQTFPNVRFRLAVDCQSLYRLSRLSCRGRRLGEYNGKFMCNQFVLRGGSCATPSNHIRPTYRNFFPPEACWQFSGLRLAK